MTFKFHDSNFSCFNPKKLQFPLKFLCGFVSVWPLDGVLQCVHVVLTAVQSSSGDVHAHGVDANVVWGEKMGKKDEGEAKKKQPKERRQQLFTDVMSFIKHNHRFLGELFGHQVCYLWVQKVVVAVDHDVGVKNLRTESEIWTQLNHKNINLMLKLIKTHKLIMSFDSFLWK